MFNKILALIMITGLCFTTVLAEEQKAPSLADWLAMIRKKIETISPQKTRLFGADIEGGRGAKENSPVRLYWKGRKVDEPITEDELADFKKAINLAGTDDRTGAISALEEFMKKYHDSALVPDAKKTLDLLKAGGSRA